MTTLLHLDSSVRGNHSLSRKLSRAFVEAWCLQEPQAHIIRRDLAETPPPFVDLAWIAASFTKEAQRTSIMQETLAVSDQLIEELEASNVLVIAAPMFNYGMPAVLKAWVDQVVRVDRAFSFDLDRGDYPLEPILSGKTLVMLTSTGEFGFGPGGVRADLNHLDTHFRVISRLLGVDQSLHLGIEYQEFGDSRHTQSVDQAFAEIPELVRKAAQSQNLEWAAT